jgi:hypothetical protein
MAESKTYKLGSGDLYIIKYNDEIPENDVIEISGNFMGEISGGAKLEYKANSVRLQADSKRSTWDIITSETATIKAGTLTWNLDNLAQLCNSSVTDDTTNGIRTVNIGGLTREATKYIVHFVHKDGDFRATMVATTGSGLALDFIKDKETICNAEFIATPLDSNGTILRLQWEYDILVTGITVAGAGDATTVVKDATLQMSATILPANATDDTVTWSITSGTGSATISSAGLLTGVSAGTVTVTATAHDGSGITGTKEITVTAE